MCGVLTRSSLITVNRRVIDTMKVLELAVEEMPGNITFYDPVTCNWFIVFTSIKGTLIITIIFLNNNT